MTETKKLVMVFKNSVGKNVSISIDDPKDNIKKNDYAFVEAVEAKIVTTDTTEYDLVL